MAIEICIALVKIRRQKVLLPCELINANLQLAMAKKEQEMALAGREEESSPVLQFNGGEMNQVEVQTHDPTHARCSSV